MVKLEFTGSVAELQALLSSLPASLTDKLAVCFTATCSNEKTLEQKAYDAAKEILAKPGFMKIEAIKKVREITSMGLKDAKDFVEAKFPECRSPIH